MVAATYFYATSADEKILLDFVLCDDAIKVFPWGVMDVDDPILLDAELLPERSETRQRYGIIDCALGSLCFIAERPETFEPSHAKAHVLDKINWDKVSPSNGRGIIDWNRTAALFWDRGPISSAGEIGISNIGSQADSMDAISNDYRKWVNRVMNWVRRKGLKLAQDGKLSPEASNIDINVQLMNAIFALPGAVEFFRSGGKSFKNERGFSV